MSKIDMARLLDSAAEFTRTAREARSRIQQDVRAGRLPLDTDINALESSQKLQEAYLADWMLGTTGEMYGNEVRAITAGCASGDPLASVRSLLKQMNVRVDKGATDLYTLLAPAMLTNAPLSWHRDLLHQVRLVYGV
jgi:hypothetical protein